MVGVPIMHVGQPVYPVTIMETATYEYHPFANAFPMMSDQEFRELVAS
jgi:hypothetical protein